MPEGFSEAFSQTNQAYQQFSCARSWPSQPTVDASLRGAGQERGDTRTSYGIDNRVWSATSTRREEGGWTTHGSNVVPEGGGCWSGGPAVDRATRSTRQDGVMGRVSATPRARSRSANRREVLRCQSYRHSKEQRWRRRDEGAIRTMGLASGEFGSIWGTGGRYRRFYSYFHSY